MPGLYNSTDVFLLVAMSAERSYKKSKKHKKKSKKRRHKSVSAADFSELASGQLDPFQFQECFLGICNHPAVFVAWAV